MKPLNYDTLAEAGYKGFLLPQGPGRVLQFGEGNFLRAFVDYFIDVANEACGFNTKVVLVQPIAKGLAGAVNRQQGLYTLYLRGGEGGRPVEQKRLISCVSHCIDPYTQFAAFLEMASSRDLRYIVSNTTEAGIVYDPACRYADAPPASFPAKLTRLLHQRYITLGGAEAPGLVVLPCELIDDNGGALKRCVQQYTAQWGLEEGFANWLEKEVLFCSTLVDRIVTGYPRDEAEALWAQNGCRDDLLDTAERFGLWVIEGPPALEEELPFAKAGLPVLITRDHKPYKQRKVRILNGGHTTLCLAAFLAGKDTVGQCMEAPALRAFLQGALFEEIIPTLDLPRAALEDFANSVLERFENPFIQHSLLAISLNSVSKWRARVLPSVKGYLRQQGRVPARLAFGFAALLAFYSGTQRAGRPYQVQDDAAVLAFFEARRDASAATLAEEACARTDFWGEDLNALPGFTAAVAGHLEAIRSGGVAAALSSLG